MEKNDDDQMFFAHVLLVVFAIATGGLFCWIHQTGRSYEVYRANESD